MLVVGVILFGHIGMAQNVKTATLYHFAHLLVVQSFVLHVTQAVVEFVVVAGEVYRTNNHVWFETTQKGQLLGVVVWTAHLKAKQQLDLAIILCNKAVELTLALGKLEVAKCVNVATLDVVGKANYTNAIFYCANNVFLHRVGGWIVVAKVCVNVQIALDVCFHTTSIPLLAPLVNRKIHHVSAIFVKILRYPPIIIHQITIAILLDIFVVLLLVCLLTNVLYPLLMLSAIQ